MLLPAGSDYQKTTKSLVITGDSVQSIFVEILDDEMLEFPETFYGHLSVDKSLPHNVHLEPNRAVATIIDDKGTNKEYHKQKNLYV